MLKALNPKLRFQGFVFLFDVPFPSGFQGLAFRAKPYEP